MIEWVGEDRGKRTSIGLAANFMDGELIPLVLSWVRRLLYGIESSQSHLYSHPLTFPYRGCLPDQLYPPSWQPSEEKPGESTGQDAKGDIDSKPSRTRGKASKNSRQILRRNIHFLIQPTTGSSVSAIWAGGHVARKKWMFNRVASGRHPLRHKRAPGWLEICILDAM